MNQKYNEHNEIDLPISKDLETNIREIESLFLNCADFVKKRFVLERKNGTISIYIIYLDGLTKNEMVESTITRPLLYEWRDTSFKTKNGKIDGNEVLESLLHHQTEAVDLKRVKTLMDIIGNVLNGDTGIFVDGVEEGLILSTKKFPVRSIGTPEKEGGLKGPKDSFTENFRGNTAMIRRRIKDPKLKEKQTIIGQRSRTVCGLMYMEDLIYPSLLKEIETEINSFTIDGILDSSMLLHLLEQKWYSPFPQVQTTERPDKAASAILEGRIVLVIDNSPEVIILPTTCNMFFQAADDYYNRFSVATFARLLRYFAAYITVLLPGLYIAVAVYEPQVLPTNFLLAIVSARNDVTFPIVVEVLLMELLFELLREAGLRLPGKMGNTIGVVGGLIVGQSAVDASLVSTMVVIVVALTAIASFAIPNEEFSSTFRLLKFLMIFLASIGGIYGIILGALFIKLHLAGLESYGIPYMMPKVSASINHRVGYQDFIMRKPIFTMKQRPLFTKRNMRKRFRR